MVGPHFIYPFISFLTFGLSLCLLVINNVAINPLYTFLCGHVFSIWGYTPGNGIARYHCI